MKVVVFGRSGQVGFWLTRTAPTGIELVTPDRGELNCHNSEAVYKYLLRERPDWVINAAAYTDVDNAESNYIEASDLNAGLPTSIAWACLSIKSKFLQLSTDYVFDGLAKHPYTPKDYPNPINFYGHTKLRGEQAIAEILPSNSYCILRTSGVYSHRRSNFFISIFNRIVRGENCKVVDDQVTRFTSAKSLAEQCWLLIESDITGVHHYAESDALSRFEFACCIREIVDSRNLCPQLGAIEPIKTLDIKTKATRPSYSVLENTLLFEEPSLNSVGWKSSLSEVLNKYAFLSISND